MVLHANVSGPSRIKPRTPHTRPLLLVAAISALLASGPVWGASMDAAITYADNPHDVMTYRHWRLMSGNIAWPAEPSLQAGTAVQHAQGGTDRSGWQFSMEVTEPVPAPAAQPASGLPLLGDAKGGNVLKTGLRKSFGPVTVRLGLKQQDSTRYGSFRSPAISVLYRPAQSGALAGISLSRASRTPGFYASGHPYGGNASASAERSQQAEIFFVNADSSPWRAKLALFQAYYRDMMDFDEGPPPSLVNRARVYMRGIETSLSRRWQSGTQAYLHAASIGSYDPDNGLDLRYRPRLQATGGVSMPLAGPLNVHASLTWFGPRTDVANLGPGLGGYAETGVMLSWKSREAQAFFAIDNMFDRRTDEFPEGWANGRRLRLGWRTLF